MENSVDVTNQRTGKSTGRVGMYMSFHGTLPRERLIPLYGVFCPY